MPVHRLRDRRFLVLLDIAQLFESVPNYESLSGSEFVFGWNSFAGGCSCPSLNTVAHGYALSIPVHHVEPILTRALTLVKKENLLTASLAWDNPWVNQKGQKRREM
jgi:hypothetical protein